MPDDTCDVLIIGGGPAGSTLATLLARRGRQVTMIEKAHHPRFHIGESLLPANVSLFDDLGVRAEVEAIGMPKWGVEFVSPDHAHRSYLEFGDALDKSMPYAWQVRRADLDELLFRNASKSGATTLEGHRARNVEFDADGATVEIERDDGHQQTWRCKYVIDATGRDTLLANKLKSKKKHPNHASSAIFGHFRNAKRLEGKKEGNISILWYPHGWFWFIPLADGTTSVGAVCWPVLPEIPQQTTDRFLSRNHRDEPGIIRAPEKLPNWSMTRSTPPATIPTPAHTAPASATPCSATPSPSSTRCSRRASTWRCRARMPPFRWSRRRWTSTRPPAPSSGPRSRSSCAPGRPSSVGSSPRHQPDDARVLHGAAEPDAHEGGAADGAGR